MKINEKNSKEKNLEHYIFLFSWLVFFLVYLFSIYIVAPGRGANWDVDDGYVLANAWNLVNKSTLDKTLPQQTIYIIYAILINLGIEKYLHLRYFFITFTAFSSLIFFSSLDKKGLRSIAAPIAAAATLLVTFTSIGTFYQFYFLALGFYFISQKIEVDGSFQKILLMLSGSCLGIQAFINASIGIGMIVLFIFMLFINKILIRSLFVPSFIITIIFLWGIYTYNLEIQNLLVIPGGHVFDPEYFYNRILLIIISITKLLVFYFIIVLLFNFFKDKKYLYSFYLSIIILTILTAYFFIINTISAEFPYIVKSYGFESLLSLLYRIDALLKFPAAAKMQVPAMAFHLLIVVFIAWVMLTKKNDKIFSIIQEKNSANLFIATIGFLLLFSSYTVPSNVNFTTLQSAFSGPIMGLAIILIASINYKLPLLRPIVLPCIGIYLTMLSVLGLYLNIPTTRPLIKKDNIQINSHKLDGIYETDKYINSLNALDSAYFSNGCNNVLFSTLDYIPLIYFILNNNYKIATPVARTTFFFAPQIELDIKNNEKWCVLDVTTSESRDFINRTGNDQSRDKIREYIKQNSTKIIEIPEPSMDIKDLVLYIKK
jgi:hypothetical protein